MAVRPINRPGSQLLGANGRDDGAIVSFCLYFDRLFLVVVNILVVVLLDVFNFCEIAV